MSYSYASLDEAWNQSKPKHGRKSTRARMTPSPSPTPSSNGTIVISDDSMSASRSTPSSPSMSPSMSPSPSMESFYSDDDRSLSPSPSPSPSPPPRQNYNQREFGGIVTRGVGSPITALDEDDFDPRGSIEATKTEFVNSLPGRPVQSSQTQQPQQFVGASSSISGVNGGGKEEKMMRHILRIQDDVREMLRNGGKGGSEGDNEKEYRFPFVETGLFLSVGLFVLLAMNVMLRMGKQHVTYRFNFAD